MEMHSIQWKKLCTAALFGVSAALAGCGGDEDLIGTGKFRVVNGISDSTSIDVAGDNLPSDLNNITVNSASGFRTVVDSTFRANVKINTGAGSNTASTSLDGIDIDPNQETTAYFPGTIVSGNYNGQGFQVRNQTASIPTGQTEVQLVHSASAAAAQVVVYITAVDAALPASPTFTVDYRAAGPVTNVASASYRIRVALASSPRTVVFDTGTTGVTLAPGARLQIAALNETQSERNSPIRLLVIPSDGTPATLQNAN